MPNLTLKCEKQCDHIMAGFCRCAPARGSWAETFDELGHEMRYPRNRIVTVNDICEWEIVAVPGYINQLIIGWRNNVMADDYELVITEKLASEYGVTEGDVIEGVVISVGGE